MAAYLPVARTNHGNLDFFSFSFCVVLSMTTTGSQGFLISAVRDSVGRLGSCVKIIYVYLECQVILQDTYLCMTSLFIKHNLRVSLETFVKVRVFIVMIISRLLVFNQYSSK